MNFHSTTASRIRETDSTWTVEYRATLHYSDTSRAVGMEWNGFTPEKCDDPK